MTNRLPMFDGDACQKRPDHRKGFNKGETKHKPILAGSQLCVGLSMSCCESVDYETPEQLAHFVCVSAL